MVRLVNFLIQWLISLSFTKVRDRGLSRVQFARDATVVADRGIISRFIDILVLVQIAVVDGLLGHLEQHLVLLLWGLHLFVYFHLSLEEILDSSIAFR